jgi:hypothetical protein
MPVKARHSAAGSDLGRVQANSPVPTHERAQLDYCRPGDIVVAALRAFKNAYALATRPYDRTIAASWLWIILTAITDFAVWEPLQVRKIDER